MLQRAFVKGSVHFIITLRLVLSFLLLCLSRLLLYFFNYSVFQEISFWDVLIHGLRFDLSAVFMINGIYIVLAAIPFRFRINHNYKIIPATAFYIGNIAALALNTIDAVYYPFNLKRMTWDVFGFLSTGDGFWTLIPRFIADFWYAFLIFVLLVFVLVCFSRKLVSTAAFTFRNRSAFISWNFFLLMVWAGFCVVGIRGGFQLKPITIIDAGRYVPPGKSAVVLNTPFTLAKTYGKASVSKKEYMPEDEALLYFNPIKKSDTTGFRPLNVVIIIMESFSCEHSALINPGMYKDGTGFTPFFDSLAQQGVFFRSFANGKRSIEGIPAITASLPSWMNSDFITSSYASASFGSLPQLLKLKNYHSSFFHGGKNGTMNFDSFCKTAGFDQYVGMDEYPDKNDYDGHWGIYDHAFFDFWLGKINGFKAPFLSVFFSLSSHHPYSIPPQYNEKFPKGRLKIQQSIAYADYSLKQFFKKAAEKEWYKNTLFIITADHASEGHHPYYQGGLGQYSIPVLFYSPGNTPAFSSKHHIAQQIDIQPSILSFLHFDKSYLSFGNNLLDSNSVNYTLSYLNGTYQYIENDECILYDGDKKILAYSYPTDSLLRKPLTRVNDIKMMRLKSIIQQFNNRLIENRLNISHE